MPYSKTIPEGKMPVAADDVAAEIHQFNPLEKLEQKLGMRDIVARILGRPEGPAPEFRVVELAKTQLVGGIASVLHAQDIESGHTPSFISTVATEVEQAAAKNGRTMTLGKHEQDGITRLAFVPSGMTREQLDDYKQKLTTIAEGLAIDAVTVDLQSGTFARNMKLGPVLKALQNTDPKSILLALSTTHDKPDWAEQMQQTLPKKNPGLSIGI